MSQPIAGVWEVVIRLSLDVAPFATTQRGAQSPLCWLSFPSLSTPRDQGSILSWMVLFFAFFFFPFLKNKRLNPRLSRVREGRRGFCIAVSLAANLKGKKEHHPLSVKLLACVLGAGCTLSPLVAARNRKPSLLSTSLPWKEAGSTSACAPKGALVEAMLTLRSKLSNFSHFKGGNWQFSKRHNYRTVCNV